jgi:bacterioferritin
VKGNPQVIAYLQEVLTAELTAINQYFLHARMCKNWGYVRLAHETYEESIGEMKHADKIIERMLYLDAAPDITNLRPLRIGKNVRAQLENDLAFEMETIPLINRAIEVCVEHGDNGTRELLEKILLSEEEHVDFLEAQLHMIKEMGYEVYLGKQAEGEEAD